MITEHFSDTEYIFLSTETDFSAGGLVALDCLAALSAAELKFRSGAGHGQYLLSVEFMSQID